MKKQDTPLVAIDLFSGGGGLTLGLKQAGFIVSAGVEMDRTACGTYAANHPETVLFDTDIRLVSGAQLIRTSPTNTIDMVAACPPCQGFSTLTSKYRREDPRNELILQFTRLVNEIKPRAIMMENVPGLVTKGRVLFERALCELREAGYHIAYSVVDAANYGVPQRRKRLVLLGSLSTQISIPRETHSRTAARGKKKWVTVRDAIAGEQPPLTLSEAKSEGGPQKAGWHIVRTLSSENLQRLRVVRAGASRATLPEELRPLCHQGRNKGFSNVYGRMSWSAPAPTITGGCTTLSKGRFGHPSALRTISVREAALLQSFPKRYVISTDYIDKACVIIGSALPPRFARIMASACIKSLRGNDGTS